VLADDEGLLHVAGDLLELLRKLPRQLVGREDGGPDRDGGLTTGGTLALGGLPGVGHLDALLVDLHHVLGAVADPLLTVRSVSTLKALAVGVGVAQVVALPLEDRKSVV